MSSSRIRILATIFVGFILLLYVVTIVYGVYLFFTAKSFTEAIMAASLVGFFTVLPFTLGKSGKRFSEETNATLTESSAELFHKLQKKHIYVKTKTLHDGIQFLYPKTKPTISIIQHKFMQKYDNTKFDLIMFNNSDQIMYGKTVDQVVEILENYHNVYMPHNLE